MLIPYFIGDLVTEIALTPILKFNGGGHLNHSIFWQNLSPNGGGEPTGKDTLRQYWPEFWKTLA